MLVIYLQNEDGGWGMHIEGSSIMFTSALNYVTLRLLGEDIDGGEGAIEKARTWILDHGGATYIPSWGKLWLSVCVYIILLILVITLFFLLVYTIWVFPNG